jgi:hypothetical protein
MNLNDPSVNVDGNSWQSATQAMVSTTGSGVSQAGTPYPAPPPGVGTMLGTATKVSAGQHFDLAVENGTYLVFLYAASSTANDTDANLFTVQGSAPVGSGGFRAQPADGGQAWARMGPFRASISNGKLSVGVTKGALYFSGVELWYPE